MASHKRHQVHTFAWRGDSTLRTDNPMITAAAYGTPAPAVQVLALLSAWLALRDAPPAGGSKV